jgi:hypothetical protein
MYNETSYFNPKNTREYRSKISLKSKSPLNSSKDLNSSKALAILSEEQNE